MNQNYNDTSFGAPDVPQREEQFDFEQSVIDFNTIFELPVFQMPTIDESFPTRLRAFLGIIREEISEGDDLLKAYLNSQKTDLEALVDLADWLGDIQVFCMSEMIRFGIPGTEVLQIIMNSNMSKLGADELPIYREDGKVMKGPNYWKPEPAIEQLLNIKMFSNGSSESP